VFRERALTLQTVCLVLDACCFVLAIPLAIGLRSLHEIIPLVNRIPYIPWDVETMIPSEYAGLLLMAIAAWTLAIRGSGLYRSRRATRVFPVLMSYLTALSWAVLLSGTAGFVLKVRTVSRLFFGYFFVTALILMLVKQIAVVTIRRRTAAGAESRRHALVIGPTGPATWFSQVLLEALDHGYTLEGLLLSGAGRAAHPADVPVLGGTAELEQVLAGRRVHEAFLVGGAADLAALAPIAQRLIEAGKVVSFVSPPGWIQQGVRGRVTEFSGVPMLSFGPMPRDGLHGGMKRAVDVVLSTAGLLAAAPLMLATALLIKLFDPGPVFFRQERVGRGGRPIRIHKLRSMRVDAERLLKADPALYARYVRNDFKLPLRDDPRISPLGRFLRKSSLDELPQLWNILKGDMSFVGPRPIVPSELDNYRPYTDLLLSVRPGLTGYWQVNGRSAVHYPDRAYMELDYAGRHSLLADLAIVAQTVPAVIKRKGAE
jgi:exopolysaccharide biosynthesis polyprenyl glycosylphosphotransferase